MEDYEVFRIVTRMLFSPVEDAAAEIIARIPSIPKHLLTEEFVVQVTTILSVKKAILSHRWGKFVDVSYLSIFSSREMYLTLVMSACIREHQKNRNIFESFLSVCALLYVICTETNKKLGADLSYLNPFISMQFYDHISGIINRHGGVHKLIEYISDHRYLRSKFKDIFASSEAIGRTEASPEVFKREIRKELIRDCVGEEKIDAEEYANDESCLSMAKKILESCAEIEHPNLPSREEVVRSFVAYRKKKRAEINEQLQSYSRISYQIRLPNPKQIMPQNVKIKSSNTKASKQSLDNHSKSSGRENKFPSLPSCEDPIACNQKEKEKAIKIQTEATENFKDSNVDTQASSCSEFKIKDVDKNQENAEWYDKIIQAVIRHNHSKSSSHENANNKMQEEANGVVQHLKATVEKLTKVLNEFDKD